jgi:soluble lytic murein transglycosylase
LIDIDKDRWYIHGIIMHTLLLFLPLFLVSFISSAWADIYTFVDKNGVVHFTNTPPKSGYKKIITEETSKADSSTLKKRKQLIPYDYEKIIHTKSLKYDLDPSLVSAIIKAESNWDPDAVSNKGAMGLMQLMPSTASDLKVDDPYDPEENIEGGTKYLRLLIDLFEGNLRLALAAYNAGPAKVLKYGGIPPYKETISYVKKVNLYYNKDISIPTYVTKKTKNLGNNKFYKFVDKDGTLIFTNTPLRYSSRP